jgi:hypothetical protein
LNDHVIVLILVLVEYALRVSHARFRLV